VVETELCEQVASKSLDPVSKFSTGLPVTVTVSEKVIVKEIVLLWL
jgi:hypothetical protein